jgi:hypothetical protein
MASPQTRHRELPPSSGDASNTSEIVDRPLWALAVAVASAHRAGADGLCANLQCLGQPAPCGPARTAEDAVRLARRPLAEPMPSPMVRHPACGRAAVPAGPSGFVSLLAPPEPTTPVGPATDATVFTPFRRPLAAATQQIEEQQP